MDKYTWHNQYGGRLLEGPVTSPGFVIIVFETETIHIPGDERSRTHPGHGYPAHDRTVRTPKIYFFKEKTEWERATLGLFEEDSKRKDVWSFEAYAPVGVKISLELV